MYFSNAVYLDEDFKLRKGGFYVTNGRFNMSGPKQNTIDLKGAYVFPGLIDIHFHGNSGKDFSNCTADDIQVIAKYLASVGTTSFSIASLTMPTYSIIHSLREAKEFKQRGSKGAFMRGVTLEGPFLSPEKKGAQDGRYLRKPDMALLEKLDVESGGLIRIVCVAPELEGALEFIRSASEKYRVSIAHTTADYETASKAIHLGARHLTHLFNAMPPLNHRQPGVIAAAIESEQLTAELICDGVHVHPSMVRAAYKLLGKDRICFISDSLSPCGMPEGEYMMGNQQVILKDGQIRLRNGTLAGSVTNMFSCMKKAVAFGWKLEDAVQAATLNPAKAIGCEDIVGSIAQGKVADFIVCSPNLELLAVYIAGERLCL